MIEINNLSLRFADDPKGLPVVENLTIQIPPGVTCLFGPNGCGKTSISRWLVGHEPDRFIANIERPAVLKSVALGYVPQNTLSIMEWLSALDNIAITHVLQGRAWKEARSAALNHVGRSIDGLPLDQQGGNLSGGEKQVVTLAREFARDPIPRLLIIDEGFVSMDYQRRFEAMSWVRDWCQRTGAAILAIGHDAEEVTLLADEVVILSPRPATVVERIFVEGPKHRDIECLGQKWLVETTARVQRAFRKVLLPA